MKDLTVIILTKNEEKNLRKCVESFRGTAKRFVIVDSFSTDGTEKLCETLNEELQKKGSKLDFYCHEWVSYADQLNWGLENTDISTEWTMRMDADEELLKELADEIEEKLDYIEAPINGIVLNRRIIFMGRWIRHGGLYPTKMLRIFRTGKCFCEQRIMDEHMLLKEGESVNFKNDFIDNNTKSLEWWTEKHNWYSDREVLDHNKTKMNDNDESMNANNVSSTQAKVKRIIKNKGYYRLPKFFRAHLYFFYRYYLRGGFLDGTEGKIYHFLQGYWYRFLVDAKIYEQEKKSK